MAMTQKMTPISTTGKGNGLRRQEPVQLFQKNRDALRRFGTAPTMPAMPPMKVR